MNARVIRLLGLLVLPLLLNLPQAMAQRPAASAPAATPPASSADEPVVGQMEHAGYGLVGSGGRHYIFGGLAVADCTRSGQRQIVTLQLDEPTALPKPDDDFLYYHELGAGHRWAIGRHPLADDSYAVYFQPHSAGATPGRWSLFHRARLVWPEKQPAGAEGRPQKTEKSSGICATNP